MKYQKKCPTKSYREGHANATTWRYPAMRENPQLHTYNLTSQDGFVGKFAHLYAIYQNLDKKVYGTPRTVSRSILLDIAYLVGDRLLPGLYAAGMVSGDLKSHDAFYSWFTKEWLSKADEYYLNAGKKFSNPTLLQESYYALIDSVKIKSALASSN